MKKKIISAVILALVFIFTSIPAFAAESSSYNYTVTVYGGAQGTINGKESDSIEVKPGQEINLTNYFKAALNDEDGKYYIKGFRESGRDNNTVDTPVFDVNRDMDFVVAYGIEGALVKYTVNYVEYGTGNSVGVKSEEFYGNAGDKPVVAYVYVDGYRPRYRNLTKTLSKDESENVFTFEYIKLEEPEPETTTQAPTTTQQQTTTRQQQTTTRPQQTTTQAQQQQPQQQQPQQQQPGVNNGDNGNNTNPDGTNTNPNDNGTNTNPDGTNTNPDDNGNVNDNTGNDETVNPQDIDTEDLGDLDVPMANVDNDGNENQTEASSGSINVSPVDDTQTAPQGGTSPWLWIIIGVVVAAIIVALIILLRKRKNAYLDSLDKEDDDNTEE